MNLNEWDGRYTIDLSTDRYALNTIMEFEHVIESHGDGTVSEPRDAYGPEVYDNGPEDGPEDLYVSDPTTLGWTLMSGWTGQHGYRGPVMHDSEFVGGAMAQDILDTPGLYVATVVTDFEGDDIGWAVARILTD